MHRPRGGRPAAPSPCTGGAGWPSFAPAGNWRVVFRFAGGHAGISPEMAIRLDKAFGGSAEAWLRLQAEYDLAQAMKRADEIKLERLSPAV
ncbi:MAG TPA: HigA family addiction module antitoxin [Rhodospirillales bacterium]|nr:HigA family addiction module antitoxin [Rhodospirillales bacterium]HJO69487.1 HigA family addiction module antitoxin [Rhodospirillales bacterium]